jgi:catechol 2,3-dioxygenase-like lactoylglutathione lyase family enzyme
MVTATVRCIVDDVDASIDFSCQNLGFQELMHPAATLAMLVREDLRLALSAPSGQGGGGQCRTAGSAVAGRR